MQPHDPPTESSDAGTDDLVGRVLEDRYRLVGELGSGGIGVVYRAEHIKLGRPVAIKVLQKEYGQNAQLRQRFEREAQALAALSQHPSIVPITDYGIHDDMPYLVMELLQGRTLQQLLADEGPLDPDRALDIGLQIVRGLAFAHGQGLIHRDLKPANIFLQDFPDSADHVRILDFGLAKFVASSQQAADGAPLTRTGQVFGTPAYMGPEQATGSETDTRTDVYAMGVILFELFAGRRPFTGDRGDLLRHHLLSPPPKITEVAPERVPRPELDALLHRAMAKERTERFTDAPEMLRALEALPRPSLEVSGASSVRESIATDATMAAMPRASTVGGDASRPSSASSTGLTTGTSAGTKSNTPLLLGAGLGIGLLAFAVVGGGITLAIVLGGGDEEPAASSGADDADEGGSASTGTNDEGGDTQEAGDESRTGVAAPNPWDEGVPEELEAPHSMAERGRDPGRRWDNRLRTYSRRNDDPRGFLLLGRIFKMRGWRPDAIESYETAWDMDPDARGDPHMLEDLVDLVARSTKHARRAMPLIERAYGPEAVPRVERELEASDLDDDAKRRLRELERQLEGG